MKLLPSSDLSCKVLPLNYFCLPYPYSAIHGHTHPFLSSQLFLFSNLFMHRHCLPSGFCPMVMLCCTLLPFISPKSSKISPTMPKTSPKPSKTSPTEGVTDLFLPMSDLLEGPTNLFSAILSPTEGPTDLFLPKSSSTPGVSGLLLPKSGSQLAEPGYVNQKLIHAI